MISEILFLKNQRNAFQNLALEEVLLQGFESNTQSDGILFIYINEPTVVCGKNQSIWEEANFAFCRDKSIQIAKRISGGGTVYHDFGNLNYTYITAKKPELVSNFSLFNQPVIEFLQSLKLEAYLNDRNDILIDGKKISGNAQNLHKNSLLGHATLLFNANREFLSKSLKHQFENVESKSIKSKRVEVANISDFLSVEMNVDQFTTQFLQFMKAKFDCPLNAPSQELLMQAEELARSKYMQIDWVYGKSPKTQIDITLNDSGKTKMKLFLEKGICTKIESSTQNSSLDKKLTGNYFEYESLKEVLGSDEFKLIAESGI